MRTQTSGSPCAPGFSSGPLGGPILNCRDAIDCELSTEYVGKPVDIPPMRRVTR
ncbi:hypothetical protein C7S15_5881 [Burkholderia cepacia]|nr:hypothetical protein [Burkholderia cepacia]